MKLETISFIFGAILILVGILGGGFEVRELKIPKVSWGPRIMSVLAGLFFIVIGFNAIENSTATGNEPAPTNNKPEPVPVPAVLVSEACDFTIADQLTEEAESEQLTILIDGKIAGTITASQQFPNSYINVSVEKPGRYSYTVDGTIAAYDENGFLNTFPCAGQGMINVTKGKHFELVASINGSSIILSLVESVN